MPEDINFNKANESKKVTQVVKEQEREILLSMKKQQRICPVHFDEANYFDYDYVDYKCSQCYNSNPTVRSRDDVTELQFRKF